MEKSWVKNLPTLPDKFQAKGTCKRKISTAHKLIQRARECSLGRQEKIFSHVLKYTVMFKAAILTP
jgi:hypothetical protein